MNIANSTQAASQVIGRTPTPSINENHARALGNIERCHLFTSKIEDVLFSDPREPACEAATMPEAAAWRSNLIANETDRLAMRLESILARL